MPINDNFHLPIGITDHSFYNDTVTVRFEEKPHTYSLVEPDGSLTPLTSVSKVCGIVDKSNELMNRQAKSMGNALLHITPSTETLEGRRVDCSWEEYEMLISRAKKEHRTIFLDAGKVGTAAHDWIETFIKLKLTWQDTTAHLNALPEDVRAANACLAAIAWMKAHNVRWVATEQKVFSLKYQYPGTLDGKAIADSCSDKKCCPHAFTDRFSLVDWKTSNHLHQEYIFQVVAYLMADIEEHGTEYQDLWVIRLGKDNAEFDPWHIGVEDLDAYFQAFLSCLALLEKLQVVAERERARKAAIAAIKKAEKAEAKAAQYKVACPKSKTFKGTCQPSCGCDKCWGTYDLTQALKASLKKAKEKAA